MAPMRQAPAASVRAAANMPAQSARPGCGRRLARRERQGLGTVDTLDGAEDWIAVEAQAAESWCEEAQRLLELRARDVRADAEMNAGAKCHEPGAVALRGDVEAGFARAV